MFFASPRLSFKMRSTFFIFVLSVLAFDAISSLADPAVLQNEVPAVHGMLLFGNQTLYLSHLPMFHPPHDYQIILQVNFSSQSGTAQMACPDFDQVLQVATAHPIPPEKLTSPILLKFSGRPNTLPLREGEIATAQISDGPNFDQIKILGQFYFETGDLACQMQMPPILGEGSNQQK